MARGDYPSAKQDQFMLRLPDGMRDRIKTAAEVNNRSMNAEIVATLEEKYPAPSPFYVELDGMGLNVGYLHWFARPSQWRPVPKDIWDTLRSKRLYVPALSNRMPGNHYFVACVFDLEGIILNVIPHMYLIDAVGNVIGDVSDAMDADERAEYNRISLAASMTEADRIFVDAMQERMRKLAIPSMLARVKLRQFLSRYSDLSAVDASLDKSGLVTS